MTTLVDAINRPAVVTVTPYDVIRATVAVISVRGFFQPTSRQGERRTPTAFEVQNWLYGADPIAEDRPHRRFDEAIARAASTAAAVQTWATTPPSDASAYRKELAEAAARPVARSRDFPFLCSAVAAWQRDYARTARARDAAADAEHSRPQAAQGDRITITATVAAVVSLGEESYGEATKRRYLLKFRDADHNVYIWPTVAAHLPAQGAAVHLTGTVKGHDTYRGTAQTYLTRCRWQPHTEQPAD